jgi:hypothetical protein
MAIVKLGRSVRDIAFSDEPGAKVYHLDLTASSLRHLSDVLKEQSKAIGEDKGDESVADAIKAVITEALGEECYEDAIAYVDNGSKGASEVNAQMLPVVGAIAGIITEEFGRIAPKRISEYIPDDAEAI